MPGGMAPGQPVFTAQALVDRLPEAWGASVIPAPNNK